MMRVCANGGRSGARPGGPLSGRAVLAAAIAAGLAASVAASAMSARDACSDLYAPGGLALAARIDSVRLAAASFEDAEDAVRCLADAARAAGTAPARDLVHGHIAARAAEAELLFALTRARARAGDNAGAIRALERLALLGSYTSDVLDTLTTPPFATLATDPRARAVMAGIRARRRMWSGAAFRTPYRDSLPDVERIAGLALLWAEVRYSSPAAGTQGVLDWDSAFIARLPAVMAAHSTADYYAELEAFLALLRDDHIDVSAPPPLRTRTIPLDTRRIDGRVVVTGVRRPALVAMGISAGDEVIAIDGLAVEEYVGRFVAPRASNSTPQGRDAHLYGWAMLSGRSGDTLSLTLRHGDGRTLTYRLPFDGWGAMPAPRVESRLLDADIGYLALNTFGGQGLEALIDSALAHLGPIAGLIVDVRRNRGGAQNAGWHLISRFIDEPQTFTEQYSAAYVPIQRAWGLASPSIPKPERVITPHPHLRHGYPVAWLIGPLTASAAEGVTAIVDQLGIATLVGEPTWGSTGQPILVPLPGGGSARIRVEDERYADGRIYIQRGIQPHVHVPLAIHDLRAGRDAVLDTAWAIVARALSPGERP